MDFTSSGSSELGGDLQKNGPFFPRSGSSELGGDLQKNVFFFRVLGVPSWAETSRKMSFFFVRVLGVPSWAETSRKIVFFVRVLGLLVVVVVLK